MNSGTGDPAGLGMQQKTSQRNPTRKARGFGQERRGEILAAATELFTSEGYSRVTTRALAQKVGLSQTGLYVYFKTKEEILRAICDRTHDAMTAEFDAAVAAARSPQEALSRLVRSYIDFGLAHPAEYQLTFTISPDALAPIEKDFSQPFDAQEPGARSFLQIRDHLARLKKQGLEIGFDPMTAVQILWFVGHGAVSLLISRSHFPWSERTQLIDSLERFVLAGLLA
ncbi:MAG: TetR/AcrR family transcriptional regulator [Alphaproteobacteria bacterium]|nr:TetR/AcrR family transcriptional regulator [Alphaproteobacteria bacterium]